MKALIFVCLLFVGCYHEKKEEPRDIIETQSYCCGDLILSANENDLILRVGSGSGGEAFYLELTDEMIKSDSSIILKFKIVHSKN